jgi:hypothetical protein
MSGQNHVVIGIHGLSRKPPEQQHSKDWISAICEGLRRNCAVSVEADRLGFELVYWAGWLERPPYGPGEDKEPYVIAADSGPLPSYRQRLVDKAARKALDELADPIDWVGGTPPLDWIRRHTGLDDVGTALLQKKIVDLATYYADAEKRAGLRKKLADTLIKHTGKRIMLVAHSMGSIVAYDVLRALGRVDRNLVVDHLVTLGSPLGMPYVLKHIRDENPSVRTPSAVRQWTNLADRRDYVAIDVHLRDEFDPNGRGVAVVDALVLNGYRAPPDPPGKANHHKIYGYLRTPEFSELVKAFI